MYLPSKAKKMGGGAITDKRHQQRFRKMESGQGKSIRISREEENEI